MCSHADRLQQECPPYAALGPGRGECAGGSRCSSAGQEAKVWLLKRAHVLRDDCKRKSLKRLWIIEIVALLLMNRLVLASGGFLNMSDVPFGFTTQIIFS